MNFQVISSDASICVKGMVDLHTSPLLLKALQQHGGRFHIDLSAVTSLDSSGVATLIEGLKIAKKRGETITFMQPPDCVHNAWQLTGVLDLFEQAIEP